ncbi:sugar ABC transporter permease [Spirillospora sp. NPDC029432]|uniref:carbohydrate ABC transporter permease n=1 Tax=Spirillospora sp. NPDC029432 TaxID=3154599 RepID=UPI003451E8CD
MNARNAAFGPERRLARTGRLYTAPSLLVILAITVFPIVFSVVLSFAEVRLTLNGFQVERLTLGNYDAMLGSGEWWYALLFTAGYTAVTVAVELALGIMAALVLERLDAARGWIMALLLIPWSMITVVSGQLWAFVYDSTYGAATWFLGLFTGSPPVIMGDPASAIAAMAAADIWKTTPFVAIIVLSGLMLIPRDVYESAEIDGAGPWTTFWRITLPMLRPTLAIAVLFRILQAFGLFDLPFVLTSGGPGTSTQSLAMMGYTVLFQDLNIGPGAAIATSTALIVLLACLAFIKVFRYQVGREEIR